MKKKILVGSLMASVLATLLGIAAVFGPSVVTATDQALIWTFRFYQLASIAGLFGIASFFIGLVYPVDVITVSTGSITGTSTTTKVV